MPGNIINLSAADIEAWPPANYTNPETRAWMPPYAGTLYAFATVCVAIRMLSRVKSRTGGFGWDDAFLVASWLFFSWFTLLAILGSEKYMTKRHMWDIPIYMYQRMAKITWMAELAFLLTGCCVRTSVLLFYRRLVDGTCSKAWIWAVWVAIAFNYAWTFAFILALVFNCTPTEAYWKSFDFAYTKTYHCKETTVNNLLAGIMAVISDFYAVALPCIMMRRLHLPTGQKLALYAIFSLGLVVVIASSVRTFYLWNVGHQSDVSSYIFDVFVWSQLELALGHLCASAASLRVFFRRMVAEPLSKLKRSVENSTHGRSSQRNNSVPIDDDVELVHRRLELDPYGHYDLKQKSIISEERTLVGSDSRLSQRKGSKSPCLGPKQTAHVGVLEDVDAEMDEVQMMEYAFKCRKPEPTFQASAREPIEEWPKSPVGEVERNIIKDSTNAGWLDSR
ncbi:hypothetical protein AC579_5345 [Pseudocercospora musae]|uniref:Rhodopsin domain-containing protein n=1 Tax=Pseudocercospora musae TaxID=113226 RepID=A0A139ISU6_9PEZI|nr:hypothetical protein AC579_5345 [Pseudocercospora musae]